LSAGIKVVDFGERFAYKGHDARQGKSSEGEQNGKENLEEVEEDPSDQAADQLDPEVSSLSILECAR
jgi:hypothetical protein